MKMEFRIGAEETWHDILMENYSKENQILLRRKIATCNLW
jgi:hypothetical protein